ncbi:hypothetical protein LHFGNBLO_005858 [Mesorhizobium sp. AR10]|uniref:hypothetical protein n=1 Tax=Mesorhizobium sp. AR10 TaxID=2865839 RepID=UPI002160B10A|nr:hypothetical protein [Mesorhizobium sp. AR10]UVK38654.1 hypothetical protein LHFGNBLO_005858 [Mesorhizobium sp. AR10]
MTSGTSVPELNSLAGIAWEQEVIMPKFRFETIQFGEITTIEEELASADLASLSAVEKANAALVAGARPGVDQSGSVIKVYDEAGYLVATVNFSELLREDPDAMQPVVSDPPTEEPGVMRSG